MKALHPFETLALSSKRREFSTDFFSEVLSSVLQDETKEVYEDDGKTINELRLRGALKERTQRNLSEYLTSFGAPGDIDSMKDFIVKVLPDGTGDYDVSVEVSDNLTALVHAAGMSALTKTFLWHRNVLATYAMSERTETNGLLHPNSFLSWIHGRASSWIKKSGPTPADFKPLPLTNYILTAVEEGVRGISVSEEEASARLSMLWEKGFRVYLSPTLQEAVATAWGVVDDRSEAFQEMDRISFSAMLHGGQYGCAVMHTDAGEFLYVPLRMSDLAEVVGLTSRDYKNIGEVAFSDVVKQALLDKTRPSEYVRRERRASICSWDLRRGNGGLGS